MNDSVLLGVSLHPGFMCIASPSGAILIQRTVREFSVVPSKFAAPESGRPKVAFLLATMAPVKASKTRTLQARAPSAASPCTILPDKLIDVRHCIHAPSCDLSTGVDPTSLACYPHQWSRTAD